MTASLPDLETRTAQRVALLGRDYRGVSLELLCDEGDIVEAGAALMRDARRPQIRFVAPAGGKIVRIERGARRRLIAVAVAVDPDAAAVSYAAPSARDAGSLRDFMLETGAWASLRTRPFGNIPDPDAEPAAIFVTALDNEPGAPAPEPLIELYADEFRAALDCLAGLGAAPLYLCHASGKPPVIGDAPNVRAVGFGDEPAAGLPGRHIHALCPIGFGGGEVWHLGYQDAIALGHLLLHGRVWCERLLALGGNAVSRPRNLLVNPGTALDDLLAGEVAPGPLRLTVGSPLCGRVLPAAARFLPAGVRQLWIDDAAEEEALGGGVVVPSEQLQKLAPPGILAVPLMRALQLGDADLARELGALELVEEDVAALSRACVSRNDYGRLLRGVLDQLEVMR